MMKIKWVLFLACLGLVFWLAACTPVPTEITTRGGTAGPPDYPECSLVNMNTQMLEPSIIYPDDGMIVDDLTPLFEWSYPGYYVVDEGGQEVHYWCSTPSFSVYLSTGPFYQDELGTSTGSVPPIDSLYTVTWLPDEPLQPGTEYRWYVRPISDEGQGPASSYETFFTGPLCETGETVAPIPVAPLNHWVFDDLGDLALYWDYPADCLPDGYYVEIADGPWLEGSPLNVSIDTPTTRLEIGASLEDCTRYYWRVRAVKDGEQGQASQLFTFRVDLTGTCPVEGYSMIRGTAWEDQCGMVEWQDTWPTEPSYGCVFPSEGEFASNGTYDPGEPGIPGLIVTLAAGACPSDTILRAVPTYHDGTYDFYWLNPGTYCVSVESQDEFNAINLLPGQWVYPLDSVGNTLASQTVTVAAGEELTGVDFGWWYDYGTDWGTTNVAVFGKVWHDLCEYTPGDPIPDPLPEGCAIDEWGNLHADGEHQVDEPGIPGVVVDIGFGPCPSAGLATSITDADGYYSFTGMMPGEYCIRIDSEDGATNQDILLPGYWTMVPSGHEGMTFRAVDLVANHTLPGQDFGWDYDNLPAEAAFTLEMNAFCRVGPGPRYPDLVTLFAGQVYPIVGRSQDGLWYFIKWTETSNCWLSEAVGRTSADISSLRTFFGPPLPACSSYTDSPTCSADPGCQWVSPAFGDLKSIGFCTDK